MYAANEYDFCICDVIMCCNYIKFCIVLVICYRLNVKLFLNIY